MSVYLYAICGGQATAPRCRGVSGRPLGMVRTDRLSALVSHGVDAATISEAELWEHERAVEGLMAKHDVLPTRFGTLVADESAVRELLSARMSEFAAALERVAGKVEVGVRIALSTPREDTQTRLGARTGTEYLREAKRDEELAATLEARLADAFSGHAAASRIRRGPALAQGVTAAFLIARGHVEDFRARVGRLNDETDYAQLVCTGPWPPYSFVSEGRGG